MSSTTTTLAAVIPTRNRATLAINAARSLLEQDCAMDVYISDNSKGIKRLRDFCERTPRMHYLHPARELSMAEHWDWAVRQTLERSPATHFTLHYDRRISKPRQWGSLMATASAQPELVLTFGSDFISIAPPPRRLWQYPWTGKRFLIDTAHPARLMATGQLAVTAHVIPVLSNCIVPRNVFHSLIDRFGSVCNSLAPDSAFMWRLLAHQDQYMHCDVPVGILYASHRSNGLGYLTGTGGDFPDYLKTYGDRPWLDQAPVPGLNLGQNILYHEHAVARRATGARLPPLDRPAVLDDIGSGLRWVRDSRRRARLRKVLQQHGWRGTDGPFPRDRPPSQLFNEWRCRFAMRWHGIVPETITGFSFRSDEKAIRFALKYPRHPQSALDHMAVLQAREVSIT